MKQVLVIDDHPVIYEGLLSRLSRQHKQKIQCHYAQNGPQAKALLMQKEMEILIIDITLEEENGFELAEKLREKVPVIFFLTMHDSSSYLLRAKKSGFKGYFIKNHPMDLLMAAISFPELRPFWADEQLMRRLEGLSRDSHEPYEDLSLREQEVFRLLAEGLNYKEIAYKLGISAKTASAHRYNVMQKIQLKNQAELIHYALELGIILPH